MRRSRKPEKPTGINGDHSALWDYMFRLDTRIDQLFLALIVGVVSILGVIIARGS